MTKGELIAILTEAKGTKDTDLVFIDYADAWLTIERNDAEGRPIAPYVVDVDNDEHWEGGGI